MMISHLEVAITLLSILFTAFANPIDIDRRDAANSTNLISDKTIVTRADASSYPYGDALPNEFQWRNWDPKDQEQKKDAEKIHNAFREWQDFVKEALNVASNKDSDTFKRWFGKQDDANEIKNVFANMWDNSNGKATDLVAKMICDREDFKQRCEASTAAYTISETGEFHVCPLGLDLQLNSDLNCENFDDSCSAKMRSLPMTLLHEMTHFDTIGEEARKGFRILDSAGGAYNCFKLDDTEKGDNAQNYAWLAGEAYWSKICSKTFKDPAPGTKAIGEDEAPPNTNGFGSPQCTGPVAFHQEEADAAIGKFCSDQRWLKTVIVPLVSFGHGKTSDGRSKALGVKESFPVNSGASELWVDISFAEDSCTGNFQPDSDACATQLRSILNGCDTAGLFPKHGGWIQDSCSVYRLMATGANDPDPLFLQSSVSGMMGNFTCTDTDTSALGPHSLLAGTCTCWYSSMPGVTDIFDKPDGGCSKIDKSADPKAN